MPRYSLNLIFTLYFCSISPRLALRWWQQHDKNTSGLLLHIYGLYTVRTMLGLVKSTHRRQRSLASSRVTNGLVRLQTAWKVSPFANGLNLATPFANGLSFHTDYNIYITFILSTGQGKLRSHKVTIWKCCINVLCLTLCFVGYLVRRIQTWHSCLQLTQVKVKVRTSQGRSRSGQIRLFSNWNISPSILFIFLSFFVVWRLETIKIVLQKSNVNNEIEFYFCQYTAENKLWIFAG